MKYIVDIKGELEGDYEIVGKYEERPQGKWIEHEAGYNICPFCKNKTAFSYLFCPYCGADMRKVGEESK